MLKNSLFSLLTVSLLTAAGPAQAALEDLAPANISRSVKKLIAKQKIGASLNLVNLDVYDGISLGLKYRIQSEPSYVDSYYTRLDKYQFEQGVSVGDLIEGLDLPFAFNISKNTDIIFARQFKSQKESVVARPYTFKNFPLTAERALDRLSPGDFVSFETRLSLVVGLNTSMPLVNKLIEAKAYTHALISGDFLVHIFRMTDNKIRLKFIAVRSKGTESGVKTEVLPLSIVGIRVVDKRIQKFADLTPGTLSLKNDLSDLFMLDYVFNLNNSMAAKAFTDIMTRKTRFKEVVVANPLASKLALAGKIMTDATDIEDMFEQDKNLAASQRRVDRLFKGSNTALTAETRFKVGLAMVGYEKGTTFTQNKVVSYDKNNVEQPYLLDTYIHRKADKLIFGLFGEETQLSANLLFASDKNFTPTQFVALTLAREKKMKSLSSRDFREIQDEVRKVLPAKAYDRIDWKKWTFRFGAKNNGYFKHEIVFQPESIKLMPRTHWRQIYNRLITHLEALGGPQAPVRDRAAENSQGWQKVYHTDMYYVSVALVTAFNPQLSAQQRHDAFVNLKKYPLWREYGTGFLISLLPPNRFEEMVKYDLVISAKGQETITFSLGRFKEQSLYKSLMYIQNVITNRSFDLRLFTDAEGNFTSQQN